jgi:hypothetical protein
MFFAGDAPGGTGVLSGFTGDDAAEVFNLFSVAVSKNPPGCSDPLEACDEPDVFLRS